VVILGIDPGSVITGYGVVEHLHRKNRLLRCGCIRPDVHLSFPQRLLAIYDQLLVLISDVSPDEVALESVFHGVNIQSLIKLCQARGAILTALANSNVPIFEYSPREVKKAVVGKGSASKEQVQFMMQRLFGTQAIDENFDATDAVALALCHAHQKTASFTTGRKKSVLVAQIEAIKQETRSNNRFEDKLKRIGVDAKSRRRLAQPKGR
jgi:crossover junction endodeoxyribonuclease RuvC